MITLSALLFSFLVMAQDDVNAGRWEVSGAFGSIHFDNTATVHVQDNINVGLTFAVARKFANNFYTSAGVAFSTVTDAGLWENPLHYFSGNVDIGYRFRSKNIPKPFMVPYIAIGTSYIKAANTLPNAESNFSGNITGGFIFWLNNSHWGLTLQDTYKFVNSTSMVSHNQITIGAAYKF